MFVLLNQRSCTSKEVIIRPRGLGLGAAINPNLTTQEAKLNKNSFRVALADQSQILKGAYFVIKEKGFYCGFYGRILDFDEEDNSKIVCKLALKRDPITIGRFSIRVVDREEYDKNSHYISNFNFPIFYIGKSLFILLLKYSF